MEAYEWKYRYLYVQEVQAREKYSKKYSKKHSKLLCKEARKVSVVKHPHLENKQVNNGYLIYLTLVDTQKVSD